MKRLVTVVALVAFGLPRAAAARAPETGLDVLRQCQGRFSDTDLGKAVDPITCLSYIRGFLDGLQVSTDLLKPQTALLCMPAEGVSSEQAMRVTIKWLEDNPKDLNLSARVAILLAMREAFPCK